MKLFRNSKLSAVVSGLTGVMMIAMLFGFTAAPAQATTVEDLQALIASLTAQITSLTAQLSVLAGGTTTTVGSYNFATNLKMGDSNADVMNLQKLLNTSVDTQVAASGVGSLSNETQFFGSLTKSAVIKFQNKYASEILAPVGLSAGTGYVGPSTRSKLNALYTGGVVVDPGSGTVVVPTGSGLTAMLSSDSPASGAVITGQALADLGHFTFVNGGPGEAKITKLVFNRLGISLDTTASNVYLFDGQSRLTDSASVSTGKASFNDSSGIFTVPVGSSRNISVKADIATGTAGQIIGFGLAEVVSDVTVNGTFPINAETHSVASATMSTFKFSDTTPTPSTNATFDPQDGAVVFKDTLTIGTRDAELHSMRFRMIGSINYEDIQNFKLYIRGELVGEMAGLDSNGYLLFDFSASPITVKTGSPELKLLADVIGGSTRTFQMSVQRAGDVIAYDSQMGQPILIALASASFSAQTCGIQTVAGGSLTITKRTDSASGNVTEDASGVTLASFDVKASGEPIKIENLRVGITENGSNSAYELRNGALFADGTQIGSTNDLPGDNETPAYYEFSLGSSLIVYPGTTVVLEVRADIIDNDGTDQVDVDDTIRVDIKAGSNNYQKMNSLSYASNTAVNGNTLTVANGDISMAKYQAYSSHTIVVPRTAYKLAEFRLTSTETEDINLNTITVAMSGGTTESTDLNEMYVVYGENTTSVKSTVAASNVWTVSDTLLPNVTLNVSVYCNLNSVITDAETTITTLTIAGTTALSGNTVTTGAIAGQTITANSGSITSATGAGMPVAGLLVSGSAPKIASFEFTALYDDYEIRDLGFKMSNTDAPATVNSIMLKDGDTGEILREGIPFSGKYATTTALGIGVPQNTTRIVDVYYNLGTIGTGFATSSKDAKITLNGFKHQNSVGTIASEYTDRAGNSQYVYKTKPTITNIALPSSVLVTGTKVIYKYKVGADAAGNIGWKKIQFAVSKTGAAAGDPELYDAALWDVTGGGGGTQVAGTMIGSDAANLIVNGSSTGIASTSATGTWTLVADTEQVVQAGFDKIYELRSGVAGTLASGDNVNTNLAQALSTVAAANTYAVVAATNADFVWSDRSVFPHTTSTADWMNDYHVKTMPTSSQSLTKS